MYTVGKPKSRGNGQGSAYKRGKVWQAEVCIYMEDGRFRKTKSGFRTKREALEWLTKWQDEETPVTMSELYKKWSVRHFEKVCTDRAKAYARTWEIMLKPLHHRDIHSVRYTDMQDLVDKAKTYSVARNMRTVLRGIYEVALKNQIVSVNSAALLEIPPQPKPDKQAFTADEVSAMWDKLSTVPFLACPLIMIYTGMRPGELLKLSPEMIDFDEGMIIGAGSKTYVGRTSPIFFPPLIAPLLTDIKPLISISHTTFDEYYKDALKKAEIRFLPPNCCRHTCATMLAKAGAAEATIQKIMRHTTYRMTMNYTHMDREDAIKALNSI